MSVSAHQQPEREANHRLVDEDRIRLSVLGGDRCSRLSLTYEVSLEPLSEGLSAIETITFVPVLLGHNRWTASVNSPIPLPKP